MIDGSTPNMSSLISLSFNNFQPSVKRTPLSGIDLENLSKLRDIRPDLSFIITGLPCEDYVGFAEDEVEEIVCAYKQIESFGKKRKPDKQVVFFGQGGLIISAEILLERSTVTIERSPYLNKHLETRQTLIVPTMDYLYTWRDVLHTLVQFFQSL